MPKKPSAAAYPPAPSAEAALRKNQYEKEKLQDAVCIVAGIFIALLFIGIASYIIRYIASRPSNTLVTGEIVGLSAPKDHPITGKLAKKLGANADEPLEPQCRHLNGKTFKIQPGNSLTAYYSGNIGHYLAFELLNMPELAKCPYEMILTPAQARVAIAAYAEQQATASLPQILPFSDKELQSVEKDNSLSEEETKLNPPDDGE